MIYKNDQHTGVFLALVSALLFGISTPFAKFLLNDVHPLLLAGLLYLGAGIGISLISFLKRCFTSSPSIEEKIAVNDMKWIALATFFGGISGPILLMYGLTFSAASSASLLLNFESLFTALIAWIIVKEHTTIRLFLGMILILAGGFILAWPSSFVVNNLLGSLLIISACFCWGIDNNITRQISISNPYLIVITKNISAGLINISLGIWLIKSLPISSPKIIASLFIGFISYGISLVFFIYALRLIGTARTSAYFSSAPFIGAILSIFFLSESFSLNLLIAWILMVIGVWIHFTEKHDHEHTHEELAHEHMHIHDEHHQHEHVLTDPPGEPHAHFHRHQILKHKHPHYPDIHHRHKHK